MEQMEYKMSELECTIGQLMTELECHLASTYDYYTKREIDDLLDDKASFPEMVCSLSAMQDKIDKLSMMNHWDALMLTEVGE
jgi:hypothetical protein